MSEPINRNGQVLPSTGRIVHFVLPDGRNAGAHRPAVVTSAHREARYSTPDYEDEVNLRVFLDGENDQGAGDWRTSARYSEQCEPGTWHWPERV